MPDETNEKIEDSNSLTVKEDTNGDSTEDNNGNSSETNNIKKIQKINFPTFKEGETWETIREKLVQASFIQKPLEALEEINDNLISTTNANFDVLNNDITTLSKSFNTLNDDVQKMKNSPVKLESENFDKNILLCDEIWA